MLTDAESTKRIFDFLGSSLSKFPKLRKGLSQSITQREPEFLQMGEQLLDIASRAGDISEDANAFTQLTQDTAVEGFARKLNEKLGEMTEFCSQTSSSNNIDELSSILETIEMLETHLQEFKRIVRSLQMLGISTRIESARLGADGRGFNTLADDVESLGHTIVSYSGQILDKSKELYDLSLSARNKTEELQTVQAQCSSDVLGKLSSNMDQLRALSDMARTISADIVVQAEQTTSNISDIVSSMQFHDIIRQQVEHVEEAIDDMIELITEHQNKETAAEESADLVGWIADVCDLQVSQLDNASERFLSAVENLKTNLVSIGENVNQMVGSLEQISGNGREQRALQHIENNITLAVDNMRHFTKQGEQIGLVMSSVADTVSEIGSFLADIEEVGAEIELIALNASIKAAHTGEKGKALGVLAQAVQKLSVDARTVTDAISSVLQSIAQAADTLKTNADSFMDTTQLDGMVSELVGTINEVKQLDEQVLSNSEDLAQRSERLEKEIIALNEQIVFHHQVEKELHVPQEGLAVLNTDAREIIPTELDTNRPDRLKKLLERYTMEEERIIHESALDGQNVGPQSQQAGDEVEVWDNVDLF